MRQVTKIILANELLEAGVSKSQIANHIGVSRRTIIRWSQSIEEHGGLDTFLECYQQAKKGARQKRKTDAILKLASGVFEKSTINVVGRKSSTSCKKSMAYK